MPGMVEIETIIWPIMLGGVLTLVTAALGDVLLTRHASSVRGLVFLVLVGTGLVMLSGLPEDLYPNFPKGTRLLLEASLAPLGGALTLSYLEQWLGVAKAIGFRKDS